MINLFIRDCTEDVNDAEIVRAIICHGTPLRLELMLKALRRQEQLDLSHQTQVLATTFSGITLQPAFSGERTSSNMRRSAMAPSAVLLTPQRRDRLKHCRFGALIHLKMRTASPIVYSNSGLNPMPKCLVLRVHIKMHLFNCTGVDHE